MARMSIDDKIGRDTRITWLAAELGWSKEELVGHFVLNLWPLCYDRLTPTLPVRDIDIAVRKPGFADKLVEAGLGTVMKQGIRVSGAAERIEYLLRAKSAGKKGGKASGKSRGSNGPSSPPRSNPPGGANLPDTVPDSASASAPVPDAVSSPDAVVDRESPRSRGEAPAKVGDASSQMPSGKKKPDQKPKLKPLPPQEALDAAEHLMGRVIADSPNVSHARAGEAQRRATVVRWGDTMRLLHERDSRSWEEIRAMVDWAHPSGAGTRDQEFWRPNIQSPESLRRNWDQMEAQRNRGASPAQRDDRWGRLAPATNEEFEKTGIPF